MKKLFWIGFILLIGCVSAFGQAEMKPGYIIKADGVREEC